MQLGFKFFATALIAYCAAPVHAQSERVCIFVSEAREAALSDFEGWRIATNEFDHFNSSVIPPGIEQQDDCGIVADKEGALYSCRWRLEDENAAREAALELSHDLEACLLDLVGRPNDRGIRFRYKVGDVKYTIVVEARRSSVTMTVTSLR